MTMNWMIVSTRKTTRADDVVAAHDERAERRMTSPAFAWSRMRRVDATLSASRKSVVRRSSVGNVAMPRRPARRARRAGSRPTTDRFVAMRTSSEPRRQRDDHTKRAATSATRSPPLAITTNWSREHHEDDGADDEVPAHHEHPESADDFTRVGLEQDEPRRRHVQREPEERRQKEKRGEGRDAHRVRDVEDDQQDDHGDREVGRDEQIERPRRQGDDHEPDAQDDERRERDVGGAEARRPRQAGKTRRLQSKRGRRACHAAQPTGRSVRGGEWSVWGARS